MQGQPLIFPRTPDYTFIRAVMGSGQFRTLTNPSG
jgi:hypothetical protein